MLSNTPEPENDVNEVLFKHTCFKFILHFTELSRAQYDLINLQCHCHCHTHLLLMHRDAEVSLTKFLLNSTKKKVKNKKNEIKSEIISHPPL